MFIKGLIIALIFELVTIFGRMIFGDMKTTFKKYKSYLKVRIHHGYIGLALILAYYFLYPIEEIYLLGVALFISDALHHFVVLPIWVGRTEFP